MKERDRPVRLALVSTDIRRDLLAPLKHFEFDLAHFYRRASYGDLTDADRDATLQQYVSPLDLYRRLVADKPEIIQGVEPFSFALQPYLWACFFAARRTGARLIAVTLENRPLGVKFGRVAAAFLRALLRLYFERVCRVVVLNEGALENVLSCGVPHDKVDKLMWGTWGVDLDEFRPSPHPDPPPLAGEGGKQTVLYVGRLIPEKGIWVLLEAWRELQEGGDARLVIAGDGPERAEVERRAVDLDGVSVLGGVKNRAVPELMREADLLVMPSLTTHKWEEQVGMVGLQAMASGLPVVATRTGAIPEYIPEEAGVLVPENDPHALAAAILDLLENDERRATMGRAARSYAEAHYDAVANVRRARELILEKCLARCV